MENFKIDLFADEVFVFTPRGTVINIPNASTLVDFAYKIHTDVGNRCMGAKVNGKIVPLDYKLKTGEIVEIITSSVPKGPNVEWLGTVKSNQAKSKIRAWFKKIKREENINKGKELLEKETKRQGGNFKDVAKAGNLEQFLKKYNMNAIEDLYAAVGVGSASASTIVSKLKENIEKAKVLTESNETVSNEINTQLNKEVKKDKISRISNPGIMVKGETDILVRFAKCCNPVPGDDIIGYITRGRGISVHRKDCENVNNLSETDASRIVEVSWGMGKNEGYIAEIQIKADDRQGLLTDVMEIVNSTNINLQSINAKSTKGEIAYVTIKMKIVDISHLNLLMKSIRKLAGVIEVYRTKN